MGIRVPESAKIVGARLKELRESAGLSLKDIAVALGVSYQQVQKYELGYNRFPVDKLFQLKRFYGIEYEDFFQGLGDDRYDRKNERIEHTLLPVFLKLSHLKDRDVKDKIVKILSILLDFEPETICPDR